MTGVLFTLCPLRRRSTRCAERESCSLLGCGPAASRLSPLSSDLGYCPSGRRCDGSQVVGNSSWRPLKQVAPREREGQPSRRAPVAERARDKSLFVLGVVFCPPLHSSSHHHHQQPAADCPCVLSLCFPTRPIVAVALRSVSDRLVF